MGDAFAVKVNIRFDCNFDIDQAHGILVSLKMMYAEQRRYDVALIYTYQHTYAARPARHDDGYRSSRVLVWIE